MHNTIKAKTLIIGLGITGYSCIRFIVNQEKSSVIVTDVCSHPPLLKRLQYELPHVTFSKGGFDPILLKSAERLIVSPGVPLSHPIIKDAIKYGIEVIGDIELFLRNVKEPVIAITGSNGKSTVTTLLGKIAKETGKNVAIGGNLGIPALDLLQKEAELYILELSSFQLKLVKSLKASASVVLNIAEDHMDRHDNLENYMLAKKVVYQNTTMAIINLDDLQARNLAKNTSLTIGFTKKPPQDGQYGISTISNKKYLCYGKEPFLPLSVLRIIGQHNQYNVLAAIALSKVVDVSLEAIRTTIYRFNGLPHRIQYVAKHKGIQWYNDSKGTNINACISALNSINNKQGKTILIAGGDSKKANFSKLVEPLKKYVRLLILIGRDAPIIARVVKDSITYKIVSNLSEAVKLAAQTAHPGDKVLLSPACASFDMFNNYQHRGNQFVSEVKHLIS